MHLYDAALFRMRSAAKLFTDIFALQEIHQDFL